MHALLSFMAVGFIAQACLAALPKRISAGFSVDQHGLMPHGLQEQQHHRLDGCWSARPCP